MFSNALRDGLMQEVINLVLAMQGELAMTGQWTVNTTDAQIRVLIKERIRQGKLQKECIEQALITTEENVPLDKETFLNLEQLFWVQLETALYLEEADA